MHPEKDYSFENYRKIKLSRHKAMLTLISILYVITQTITVANQTYDQYGYHLDYIVVGFGLATGVGITMYALKYRLDYMFYKTFFVRSYKLRIFYAHNQIVGPLLVYLTVYLMGLFGIALMLIGSRAGHDYRNFKNDVLVLNRNFEQINQLINELLTNQKVRPDVDADALGLIKYNISMYNMYEIALFEEQAKMISYEQLIEKIKE